MNILKLLCPALSGLFTLYGSSGGGGSGNSTSTVKNAPADQVLPYLQPYMDRASALSNTAYKPYKGQQIADLNDAQQAGMSLQSAQALNGFQGQQDGNNLYQQTLRGDFLSPESNPYLQATAQGIGNEFNRTTGAQNSSMQRTAGAFGNSGLSQKMSMDNAGLAGQLNNLYGQNYANERGMQQQALGMMPTMQNMGYTDSNKLTQVGDAQRQYQQDLLNQEQANYAQAMQYPYAQLDVLGNAIKSTMGAGGSSTTSTPTYKPSPMAGAMGGAMAGYGMGSAMGYGGLGAAGGAIMGGLL
jgi:hypothetical protein